MIGEHFNSSNVSSSSCKDPALEAKEKEERKKASEAKKEEKNNLLEHDFSARASAWLQGINKDLGKLGQAISSAPEAEDPEVRKQRKAKFLNWHHDITDFRKYFEKQISTGKDIDPKIMSNAEDNVKCVRRDIKAWNKIKDLYLPEDDDDEDEDS